MFNKIFSNYLYGAKFVPLIPIVWEASNQMAKALGIVNRTLSTCISEEFQSRIPWEFDSLIPEQGVRRLAQRQFFVLLSNQLTPLYEEFICCTVIQYGLLTVAIPKILQCLQSKPRTHRRRLHKPKQLRQHQYKLLQNPLTQKICRIAISSFLFGLLHYGVSYEVEAEMNRGYSQDKLNDLSWMQVTGNMGAGLVYRTVYELAGQNVFAAWGTHAVYNYLYDLMYFDFWY